MTRTDIIDLCTKKLGLTDAATLTIAGTFFDARHAMIWNEELWRQTRYQESISVIPPTQDVTLGANCEFVTGCRWAGAYELLPLSDSAALALDPVGYDATGVVLGFVPLGKTSAGLAQIRLMRAPTEAKTLLVFGKRKVLALAGGDSTPIPGEDMALIEFLMGDLYEWLRQLSKAQYFNAKAVLLLTKMKEIETAQTAEIRRLVPTVQMLDGDYGGDSLNPLG